MKKDLLNYMISRYDKARIKPADKGPVVTISRDYGCSANIIARKLIEEIEINTKTRNINYNWQWINKEILELTAKELNIPEFKIEHLSSADRKGFFGDIIASFGQHYTNDKTVRKSLMSVIASFADAGNVIIVGRGGVSITRDIKKSLHFSIQAPFKWRVTQVCKKRNMPFAEVEKITKENDHKRKLLRDYYFGGETDNTIFDIVFNKMTMTEDEIVQAILKLMKIRKFI
ncbi:MAG: cytidylate kinase-like family protein [Chlorobi bacterium]|nr:cytidylate kinase-like family protein [Chlorobiota bacterium]